MVAMPHDDFPNMPLSEHMTPGQMATLVLLERTGGAVSLVAVLLIFAAYALTPDVRNVQNTFIVFASVSNVGASVASIVAMNGLIQGRDSSLCQAQAFMFEMFMQSDPWWSLAMAVNVFLVFYFRTSPDSFQKWWWLYCVICYGGPFIIALVLLLIKHPERGSVYGEATIWCWVDREWDDIRIYTYYMLIWVCIIGSLILYFMVGYHVFRSRNQLRSFSTSKSRDTVPTDEGARIKLPSVPQDGFYGTVITEVQVIHSTASSSTLPSEPKRAHLPSAHHVSFDERERQVQVAASQFFSTVTSSRPPPSRSRRHGTPKSGFGRFWSRTRSIMNKFVVEDPIKRAYLRTSFLFALSVLVTWIPSSMNRIHSWIAGESPFEYHVATAAVLPLQGLWNSVIFFVTSGPVLKHRMLDLWEGRRGDSSRADGLEHDGARGVVGSASGMVGGMRRSAVRDDIDDDDSDESSDETGRSGSDVELSRMADTPTKRSCSL